MKRRDLMVAGGAIFCGIGGRQLLLAQRSPFDFRDLSSLPGFRLLDAGPVSGARSMLVGLDAKDNAARVDQIRANPRPALFPSAATGKLPIAIFGDFNCPYCRVISKHMVIVARTNPVVSVDWHDLALLGPGSERSLRAATAARFQNAYLPVHETLMTRLLRPGPNALRTLADDHGMDAAVFIEDQNSARTQAFISDTNAVSDAMGIGVTPVTVVGKTLVIGAIAPDDLDRLIDLEISEI